ncbi:MAG: ABC transporter ATP-binding protein [Lentisphaeria bacterium]|nr:ABC transporter ATP-binding protein [Lentisphaeria bacterium]NQZ67766.1 ABC transporter ATP-binding protein [Lentisphaeria bacterium]
MSFLTFSDLEMTYPDGTHAVKGINAEIEKGEFIVLLGPSGCGKTTTLRMIAGLEIATAGSISMDTVDSTNLRPGDRDIGFVFQFYALYPHMSVKENILFPLVSAGIPKDEANKRLLELAKRLGLTDMLKRKPTQLSGGDQQRVSLARAMIRNPKFYLMDEPLGTLDADRRQEMAEYIKQQQIEMAVTTIYVTHDQEEAMSLADRIIVMKDGLIQQIGKPNDVYDNPANLFVANFVGSPGMNQLKGSVSEKDGQLFLKAENSDCSVTLTENVKPGDEVVLGIRSEFIHADKNGDLEGTVTMNEYQGAYRIIHMETGFGNIIMRADASADYQLEEKIMLSFNPQHTRLFDTVSGELI